MYMMRRKGSMRQDRTSRKSSRFRLYAYRNFQKPVVAPIASANSARTHQKSDNIGFFKDLSQ